MMNNMINNEVNTNETTTQVKRRVASWFPCGTDIKEATSISEALQMSGLDYEVVKAPVYLSNGYKIPGQFCTKKKNTNDVFGIVGKDFTVVQNREAFEFIDAIIPEGLTFEKAGETGWMNWIIASLPQQYVLGDAMTPYIIFQNSHTGGSTLKASISPLRLACSNQFTIAWKEAESKIALKHTTSIIDKMHSAQEVLGMAANHMDVFRAKAEKLALEKVSDSQVKAVVEALFPMKEEFSTRKINSTEANRQAFMAAYNEDDLANFKGTQWGLLNAFSDYITHKEPGRSTEKSKESRFINVTMNTGLMENFLYIMKEAI